MNSLDPQGSEGWYQARLGKLTASGFSKAVAKTKSGWSESRYEYMGILINERLTGIPVGGWTSPAMKRGKEYEPLARSEYAKRASHVTEISEVGFIDHPTIPWSGASPDGFVNDHGLVEIKVPLSHTHQGYLLGDSIPKSYIQQVQWQMACTGKKWCDWVSFDPDTIPTLQMKIVNIPRDDEMIAEMQKQAEAFLEELEERKARLLRMAGVV